jgi:hypothetical protein
MLALGWLVVEVALAVALSRLAKFSGSVRTRRLCRWAWVLGVAALTLLAGAAINELGGLDILLLRVAGVAGVVALLASVPLFAAALILVWRGLEIAAVQSGAVRRDRRAWERPEPGSRSPAEQAAPRRPAR